MPDYRLYFLDGDSHIHGSEDICAGDDGAAISLAQDWAEKGPLELWTGSRKVWRLDPSREAANARHD